jgi:hypothetical protein
MPEQPTHLDLFSGIPSEDSPSPPSGPASAPLGSVMLTHSALPSSRIIGRTSKTLETSQPPISPQLDALTYSPADGHASHFPLQDSSAERQTIATYGRQCFMLSELSDPLGFLVKTLLTAPTWFSPDASMTWRSVAISPRHSIFRLALLDYRRWNGTSGLLPRVMSSEWRGTPRGIVSQRHACMNGITGALRLHQSDGIYCNPTLCEVVKGFPITWTELNPSATPSSRRSPTKS